MARRGLRLFQTFGGVVSTLNKWGQHHHSGAQLKHSNWSQLNSLEFPKRLAASVLVFFQALVVGASPGIGHRRVLQLVPTICPTPEFPNET